MTSGATTTDGADAGAVFDEHMEAEFELRSVETTMATMTGDPTVLHVPTSVGGHGRAAVAEFYRDSFIGTFPDDFAVSGISRTVGIDRLVDEIVVRFTHDREVPIFLPGVAPTGRFVEVPLVVVVGLGEGGRKVASERIYWDQASVLVQVGLIDPATLPVRGAEQVAAVLTDSADNELLQRSRSGRR